MSRFADARLAPYLARDYVGVRHVHGPTAWVQLPLALVSLIVTFEGPIEADGHPLPNAWIGGLGSGSETVRLGCMNRLTSS